MLIIKILSLVVFRSMKMMMMLMGDNNNYIIIIIVLPTISVFAINIISLKKIQNISYLAFRGKQKTIEHDKNKFILKSNKQTNKQHPGGKKRNISHFGNNNHYVKIIIFTRLSSAINQITRKKKK